MLDTKYKKHTRQLKLNLQYIIMNTIWLVLEVSN